MSMFSIFSLVWFNFFIFIFAGYKCGWHPRYSIYLNDVVSHGVSDSYKDYLQFLTPKKQEYVTTCLIGKTRRRRLIRMFHRDLLSPYCTYHVSSQTSGYQIGHKHVWSLFNSSCFSWLCCLIKDVQVDESKVEAIKSSHVPTSIMEVRIFHHITSFY